VTRVCDVRQRVTFSVTLEQSVGRCFDVFENPMNLRDRCGFWFLFVSLCFRSPWTELLDWA
jgi:hypothetical protein